MAAWAAAQGVEATEEELLAYAKAATAEGRELSDEDLGKVASGGYGTSVLSCFFVMYCHMGSD